MNIISIDFVTKLLFQMFSLLHVLLAGLSLFVSRPRIQRLFVCVNKKARHVDTSDGECTEYGTNSFILLIQRHSVKRLTQRVSSWFTAT